MQFGYDSVGNVQTISNNIVDSAIQPDSATVGVGPLSIVNFYDNLNRLYQSMGQYRGHASSGEA